MVCKTYIASQIITQYLCVNIKETESRSARKLRFGCKLVHVAERITKLIMRIAPHQGICSRVIYKPLSGKCILHAFDVRYMGIGETWALAACAGEENRIQSA